MKTIFNLFFLLFFSSLLYAQDLNITDVNTTEVNITDTNVTVVIPTKKGYWSKVEFEYELDAYYSNISWNFPLTDDPIPDALEKGEFEIYKDLLLDMFPPRSILIELSVNPLPVIGVYLKDQERTFYDDTTVSDLKVIEAVTAGFEEPYSLAIFIGNTVKFTRPGTRKAGSNRAYGGILISLSDQHIKQNVLVQDKSYEIEWKIIGSRDLEEHKLSWSYRIGTKIHENPYITDSVYFGIRRSILDFEAKAVSWFNNSAIEFTSIFSDSDLQVIGHEIYFEKKFPVTLWGENVGVNFGLGYIYQGNNKYSGDLKAEGINQDQLIIRPNIQF